MRPGQARLAPRNDVRRCRAAPCWVGSDLAGGRGCCRARPGRARSRTRPAATRRMDGSPRPRSPARLRAGPGPDIRVASLSYGILTAVLYIRDHDEYLDPA